MSHPKLEPRRVNLVILAVPLVRDAGEAFAFTVVEELRCPSGVNDQAIHNGAVCGFLQLLQQRFPLCCGAPSAVATRSMSSVIEGASSPKRAFAALARRSLNAFPKMLPESGAMNSFPRHMVTTATVGLCILIKRKARLRSSNINPSPLTSILSSSPPLLLLESSAIASYYLHFQVGIYLVGADRPYSPLELPPASRGAMLVIACEPQPTVADLAIKCATHSGSNVGRKIRGSSMIAAHTYGV